MMAPSQAMRKVIIKQGRLQSQVIIDNCIKWPVKASIHFLIAQYLKNTFYQIKYLLYFKTCLFDYNYIIHFLINLYIFWKISTLTCFLQHIEITTTIFDTYLLPSSDKRKEQYLRKILLLAFCQFDNEVLFVAFSFFGPFGRWCTW